MQMENVGCTTLMGSSAKTDDAGNVKHIRVRGPIGALKFHTKVTKIFVLYER